MFVAGIDPGLTGGLAFIRLNIDDNPNDLEATAVAMPTRVHFSGKGREVDVRTLKYHFENAHRLFGENVGPERISLVVIEHVGNVRKGGRPQGASSMFSFGDGFGAVRTTVDLCGFPVVYVRPQAWQKTILAG